jgi:hypothetical protein
VIKALSDVIRRRLRRAADPVVASKPEFESLEARQMFSAPPVPITGAIKVKNLFDSSGISINESLVTVPFDKTIRIKDSSQIQVRGYAVNPLTGAQKKLVINVLSVERGGDSASLIIHTDRLMRKNGGKILLGPGAVSDKNNDFLPAQTISSPKGQNKERFTLASRAFTPTNVDFFTQDLYGTATAPIDVSASPSEAAVTKGLTAFLNKKVAAGAITQAQMDQAITRYNDNRTKAIIPEANMRAALVSLVGTLGEQTIAAYLEGQNATGLKAVSITFDSNVAGTVEVAETTLNSIGRLRTKFRTQYAGEPFQALSAALAHEILHQDGPGTDGQPEEIMANMVQTMVWAEQLLIDPFPASSRTTLVRMCNDRLLAMLQSGKALFPRVGLQNAALLDTSIGVFPGADAQTGGVYTSYENFVRRLYETIGIGNANTVGNPSWTEFFHRITNTTQGTPTFANATIDTLDASQQIITDKNAITLAGILRLSV